MSDSRGQERPAKRLKLAPHPQPASLPEPGPQLRFKPTAFPSVEAPPRRTVDLPLSWVNNLSTTRPKKRVRAREPSPSPEPQREIQHARGRVSRRGGRGGRGGRRRRGNGRVFIPEPDTCQTEETTPVVDADLEPAYSLASTESVSSQVSIEMSPEYLPEASSEASSGLSSEASSEVNYDSMELDAATPLATVVMSQDITNASSPLTESTLSPTYYEASLSNAELQSQLLEELADALAEEFPSPAAEQPSLSSAEGEHSSRRPRHGYVSPFKDCLDTFGKLPSLRFPRPTDGTVNSYIKFNWPKRDGQGSRPSSKSATTQYGEDEDDQNEYARQWNQSSSALVATNSNYQLAQASPGSTSDQFYAEQPGRYSRSPSLPGSSTSHSGNSSPSSSSSYARSWDQQILRQMTGNTVPKLPSHFGFVSQMDHMDRRFFDFYIKNWCPGRSILKQTNLWLTDFACMEGSEGVRSAIQSLAGVYVYDYQPLEKVSKRINLRYRQAEARLSHLLEKTDLSVDEASELITILCIMSMHDIVLTERRCKWPEVPRWLKGTELCEHFLESIDEGSRFWSKENIQLSSLRNSQSVIVGRALILSQLMTPLPSPRTFDPVKEANRFGWLLYGNNQDMYEIHGGCGFSKKLLHCMSQITFCSARLNQCPESPVVPITIQYIFSELLDMKQWSNLPLSTPFEDTQTHSQVIEWIRAAPEGYIVGNTTEMTEATGEAWRVTAIIYLQCRALRLPRDHPDVIAYLSDLAKCISIMPTSGYQFTAQAPLFPVFLLGMLATDGEQADVAQKWFDSVTSTPVRSSVPPLYETLKRIWTWIDDEPSISVDLESLDDDIANRYPWWEHLIQRVQEKEQEILCLT
ncbi:fungal-specific transcription factor domain-containing protein [Trichoderma austrokoningii]